MKASSSAMGGGTMPMAEWSLLQAEFTWIYESRIDPEYRISSDHFPGQSAILLREGAVRIESEHGQVTASPGQWIFPRQGRRLQCFSDDARILSLHFSLHWSGVQPLFEWPVAVVLDACRFPRLESQAESLLRRVERRFPGVRTRLPWTPGDLSTHLWIQAHFAAWLHLYVETLLRVGCVPSRQGRIDHRVLGVVQKLDRHPIGEPLLEKDLATSAGLSISQLDRLFGRQFGQTPSQYLDQRRLQTAITLLHQGSLPVKQIAFKLGFHSLAYFSRWFRKGTGLSPRGFKKMGLPEYRARPALP